MKFFTDCSGPCYLCALDFCLAGHGDDDYIPASKEQIMERLDKGQYSSQRKEMTDYLRRVYGIEYGNQA